MTFIQSCEDFYFLDSSSTPFTLGSQLEIQENADQQSQSASSHSFDVFSLFLSSLFSVSISATLSAILIFAVPQDVILSATLPRRWIAFIVVCLCAVVSAVVCQRRNCIGRDWRQKCHAQGSIRCVSAIFVAISLTFFGFSLALPHLLPKREPAFGPLSGTRQLTGKSRTYLTL